MMYWEEDCLNDFMESCGDCNFDGKCPRCESEAHEEYLWELRNEYATESRFRSND